MLYLSRNDIATIVSYKDLVSEIEKAYKIYDSNEFYMPDRIHIHKDDNTLLYMPCFTDNVFGTKMITVFPNNYTVNQPAIQGMMILNDVNTGTPIAMLDGATLTAYRTGAVGGVGAKYLSRENCKTVGLIGAGVQGYYQLLYISQVRKIEEIYIHDIYANNLPDFKTKLENELPNVKVTIATNVNELLTKSEIIVTATNAEKPVLPNNKELLRGKHIIAIGSYKPCMQELPEEIFTLIDNIYVDTEFSTHESGDLINPLKEGWISNDNVKEFSKIVANKIKAEVTKTTVFKSVGMALFDVVVANYIYRKAVEKGIGQDIKL